MDVRIRSTSLFISPLYRLIERYLPEFERTYDQRYAPRYGPWRPIIGQVARKFLRYGDLHFGFARVRCPDCPLPELPELPTAHCPLLRNSPKFLAVVSSAAELT